MQLRLSNMQSGPLFHFHYLFNVVVLRLIHFLPCYCLLFRLIFSSSSSIPSFYLFFFSLSPSRSLLLIEFFDVDVAFNVLVTANRLGNCIYPFKSLLWAASTPFFRDFSGFFGDSQLFWRRFFSHFLRWRAIQRWSFNHNGLLNWLWMEVHLQVQSISLESNLELWTVYCSLLSGENERKCIYKFKVWLLLRLNSELVYYQLLSSRH